MGREGGQRGGVECYVPSGCCSEQRCAGRATACLDWPTFDADLPPTWRACVRSIKEQCQGLRLVRLPKQDNHCDCGLFLLSYVEFFAAGEWQ